MKSAPDTEPALRPWPSFALAAAFYVPAAFVLCSYLVRHASPDDYLTPEVRGAHTMIHLPASIAAVALCLISILRYERHLWIASILLLTACAWLGLALALSHLNPLSANPSLRRTCGSGAPWLQQPPQF